MKSPKCFLSSFNRQNLAYEVQAEKSIQNCYAALPVDCYREMAIKLPCSKGEIVDIVHMKELRYMSFEGNLSQFARAFWTNS
ncbi:Bloom syndrome protein -like protein [Caligus rogercresseyi]|uniref:Bloom syndrome protein -like protein n=1 Tax=Caligus rogercresseyi TaxID=217165 RepID=A0A7T8KIX3_CALRO|nr:Bloom syndrome protein -like protein [Caligus rogercresseyi]